METRGKYSYLSRDGVKGGVQSGNDGALAVRLKAVDNDILEEHY
jgi:hypothetical protein